MTALPRGGLPPIAFAEKSPTLVESDIITAYEAIAGRTLAAGDPVRLFLLSVAAIIIQQRSIIDFAAKQNFLSYAQGPFMDYLGERVNTPRLLASKARTTIRYVLSSAQGSVYTVPIGTQVTNGVVTFETTALLQIPIGQTIGDVAAACTVAGEAGNNYLPGQITTQVNPLPFVRSVTNTTTSQGGSEIEDDDSYYQRIRLAPASFSVAGPRDAYAFWAFSANPAIIDVAVESPTPGVVDIRPLLDGGALPGPDVIAQVQAVLSAETRRPLTDDVQVSAPGATNYNINFSYYISKEDSSRIATIQAAVAQAVDDYRLWQKSRIGRDINPDELIARVKAAGAKRLIVSEPEFTNVAKTWVAQDGTLNITYAGLEDA